MLCSPVAIRKAGEIVRVVYFACALSTGDLQIRKASLEGITTRRLHS